MSEPLKPGTRVRLLHDVCRGAVKGAAGTVAEILEGFNGHRYGVKLDANEGRVTTDVSAREIEPLTDPAEILRDRGAELLKQEDRHGDTKSGWWMDRVFLGPKNDPAAALRNLNGAG